VFLQHHHQQLRVDHRSGVKQLHAAMVSQNFDLAARKSAVAFGVSRGSGGATLVPFTESFAGDFA
jgi:hypothetical protein